MPSTAERIRSARAARGFTVQELAKRSELSVSTIRRAEAGRGELRVLSAYRLAVALAVTMDYIVLGEDERIVDEFAAQLDAWGA